MQWYVYLITIPAAGFLGQIAVGLIGGPVRAIFRLRRRALQRMLSCGNIALPKPRELAISSREIREHEQAVRNVREAQRSFRDLGTQLLVLSESEPAVRILMDLLGLNIILAGHELINLSEAYAMAKTDSEEMRREIERAVQATRAALGASDCLSRNDLTRIRLEPMYPRDGRHPARRNRPLGRPRLVSHRPVMH